LADVEDIPGVGIDGERIALELGLAGFVLVDGEIEENISVGFEDCAAVWDNGTEN
jgi:hypothetical protein